MYFCFEIIVIKTILVLLSLFWWHGLNYKYEQFYANPSVQNLDYYTVKKHDLSPIEIYG